MMGTVVKLVRAGIALATLGLLAGCQGDAGLMTSAEAEAWRVAAYAPGPVLAYQNRVTDPPAIQRAPWGFAEDPGFGDLVLVMVEVDPQGRVAEARAVAGLGDRLLPWMPGSIARQAVERARKLRFQPFTRDGKAVTARLEVRIPVGGAGEVSPAPSPLPPGDLGGARIELRRTACYGTCPAYTLTLTGSGEVLWQGEGFVGVPGEVRDRIDPAKVRALLDMARTIGFFGLKDVYRARVTDNPTTYLTITVGGVTKRIEDYSGEDVGMPAALTDLQLAVDRAARTVRWIEGDDGTVPSLKASGWPLDGPEAGLLVACLAEDRTPDNARAAIAQLLAAGAPANRLAAQDGPYPACEPAVVSAAREGDRRLFDLLTRYGALTGADNELLARVVTAAAVSGAPDLVEASLRYRPPLDRVIGWDNGLPLVAAASSGQYVYVFGGAPDTGKARQRIVALLLDRGADPRLAGEGGNTALHQASDAVIARMLIAACAPLEARNERGETPLLSTSDEDVALALIAAGADITAEDQLGDTIADAADNYDWPRVRAVLAARAK